MVSRGVASSIKGKRDFSIKALFWLLACFLIIFPIRSRADILITDAATGTNGRTTCPANPVPLASGDSLTVTGTGSITTDGTWANGIDSNGNPSIDISGSLLTRGDYSHGIHINGWYGNVDVSGSIATQGDWSYGISGISHADYDISGIVTTLGENARGVLVYGNNTVTVSGSIDTAGADAITTWEGNNALHISGNVSAAGGNAIYKNGWNDTFHILTGAGLTGNIINRSTSSLNPVSILTFGYGADAGGRADTTRADNGFSLVYDGSILIDSQYTSGKWDGYFAGGTTTLAGEQNRFNNIFIGGAAFDGAAVPAGKGIDTNLNAIAGAAAQLNVTQAMTTSGTISIGSGSDYALSGTHTHTGTDADIAGSLTLAGGSFINNASGGSQAVAVLNVAAGGTGTLGGSAATAVTEADIDGTLNYTADAATTFGTANLSGTLNQNSGHDLVLTALNVADGQSAAIGGTGNGSLSLDVSRISGDLTIDRDITSTGTFTVDSGSTYALAGIHTHTGTDLSVAGTLNLSGTLNQNAGNDLTVNNLRVAALENGIISGTGAGSLTIDNAIVNGTLSMNRAVTATHALVVGETGNMILRDTLTSVGGVENSGRVTVPAGSTATISGDYIQSGSGAVQVSASSMSNFGQLTVTGTADLSANNLFRVEVSPNDTLAVNDILPSVLSAGNLVINPDTLEVEDNSAMWKFVPAADTSTLDLTVLRQLTCLQAVEGSPLVANPVATGGAGVLDELVIDGGASSDMQAVLDEMGALETSEEVAEAVAQTMPALAASGPQIGFDLAGNGATQVVQNRLNSFSGLSAGDPVFEDRFAWVKPFYSRTDQDRRNGVDGYKADTYGLAVGADGDIGNLWRLGTAFSYGTTDVESDSAVTRQQLEIETWQGTLYATADIQNDLTLNLIGALGFNRNDAYRTILFGGVNRTANASYDSIHVLVEAELGKSYVVSEKLTLGVVCGLNYIYLNTDGYTETGAGGLSLVIQDSDSDTLVASIGGKLSYSINPNQRMTADVNLGYDFFADTSSLVSTYTGGGPAFVVQGNRPDEIVYRAGLGYELTLFNSLEIAATYRFESREDFLNQSGSVNFRVPF